MCARGKNWSKIPRANSPNWQPSTNNVVWNPASPGQVAEQLMSGDALAAHARDELGVSPSLAARPVQAALTSAATFAVGAALPLGTARVPRRTRPECWSWP